MCVPECAASGLARSGSRFAQAFGFEQIIVPAVNAPESLSNRTGEPNDVAQDGNGIYSAQVSRVAGRPIHAHFRPTVIDR